MWESIAREVLTRSEGAPLLLVLEDLHWADTGSLRVLRRLIASSAAGQRLAVVMTRRQFPEPTGSLADVGEELARHHATRLDLSGLGPESTRALVDQLAGDTDAEVVTRWHTRSGGNPFFLIELARLGGVTDPDALPATVREVVTRRLEGLPQATRSLLLLAAVLGRECSLDVLAAVAGQEPDAVEEALAPARETGLVREPGPGTLAFAHALTRDAVAATATATGLARQHARVAHALSEGTVAALVSPEEQVAEQSRHWLAAGPSYAGRAWRAAVEAAAQARRSFSWVEAATLMAAATDAHRRDPAGTPEERIDLLLQQARDCQPNSEWDQVLPLAGEAVALARRQEDVPRLAAAAAAGTANVIWMPQQWYEVPEDMIEDLRWALRELPTSDSPDRCRVMVTLAVMLYYDPDARAETAALADEGHAMARRIGDPALLWHACNAVWKALWTPDQAERRRALAEEGLEAARAAADPDSEAVARVLLAGSAIELGDAAAYAELAEPATRLARRRRNSYALMAMDWLELSLASMRGDQAAAAPLMAELVDLRPRLNPLNEALQVAGMHVLSVLWNGQIAAMVEPFAQARVGAEDDFGHEVYVMALARAGEVERLRAELASIHEHRVVNWGSVQTWSLQAEGAAVAADASLASRMVDRLEPLSGRMTLSGISTVFGPVDAYLAMALHAAGRPADARAAADRALEQSEAWRLPAFASWFYERRETLGF